MKQLKSLFKTNIIYGLIVLVPIAIILLLLGKIVEILNEVAKPLGLQSTTSAGLAMILAIIVLVGLCFIVGALLRTRIGSWSFERFESSILRKLPGYEIINRILRGFVEDKTAYPPAMIRLYDSEVTAFGFVMDENDKDQVTVFIPMAPMMTVGHVHVVDRRRLTLLDAGALEVTECIAHWGIGSQKVLKTNPS